MHVEVHVPLPSSGLENELKWYETGKILADPLVRPPPPPPPHKGGKSHHGPPPHHRPPLGHGPPHHGPPPNHGTHPRPECLCAEPPSPPMVGGYGEQQDADSNWKTILLSVQEEVERKESTKFETFDAISYRVQTVAGSNYLIKAQTADEEYIHVEVHVPLPSSGLENELKWYETGKVLEDPLVRPPPPPPPHKGGKSHHGPPPHHRPPLGHGPPHHGPPPNHGTHPRPECLCAEPPSPPMVGGYGEQQ